MCKYPIYAILAGMLLTLASCIPVAGSLYRMAVPVVPERFELSTDGQTRLNQPVENAGHIMLLLGFELPPGGIPEPGVRYRAEVSNGDQAQQRLAGVLEAGGNGRIEKRLPVLRLDEGQSSVELDIEIDSGDNAHALLRAWGEIHRDPPRFALSFVNTVVIWTLGTLLGLIGAIQWGRHVALVQPGSMPIAEEERSERIWCMLCHLSALLGYIIPFAHVVAPLVIWITRRGTVRGVDDAGRESLNFQLTVSLFGLIGVMLSALFVGLVLLFVLVVFQVSMVLFASVRAQRGEEVRYPVCIRIIGPPD